MLSHCKGKTNSQK